MMAGKCGSKNSVLLETGHPDWDSVHFLLISPAAQLTDGAVQRQDESSHLT